MTALVLTALVALHERALAAALAGVLDFRARGRRRNVGRGRGLANVRISEEHPYARALAASKAQGGEPDLDLHHRKETATLEVWFHHHDPRAGLDAGEALVAAVAYAAALLAEGVPASTDAVPPVPHPVADLKTPQARAELHERAHRAAMAAAADVRPHTRIVAAGDGEPARILSWDEHTLGSAWVTLSPANGRYARWLLASFGAPKDGGDYIWARDHEWTAQRGLCRGVDLRVGPAFGQGRFPPSIDRLAAAAEAHAQVLVEHGIDARSDWRDGWR